MTDAKLQPIAVRQDEAIGMRAGAGIGMMAGAGRWPSEQDRGDWDSQRDASHVIVGLQGSNMAWAIRDCR